MSAEQNTIHNYILFLPKWYPSRLDSQLGIFVQKHGKAISLSERVIVLYVVGDSNLKKYKDLIINVEPTRIEYICYYKKSNTIFSRGINFLRSIRLTNSILKEIFKTYGNPGIIHSHILLRPALFAWYYSKKLEIPYLHTEHWTGFIHEAYRNKSFIYKYLCRKVIAEAQALTTVSVALQTAMKSYKIANSKTQILPNVIEINTQFSPLERNDGKIKILSVADLVEKNKNISGTLKVLSQIKKEHKEIEFHLIGGGQDEKVLKDLARSIDPKNDWIFFYGRKDNTFVLNFIQGVDFLITNSNIETFSVITAEAIACGKPVIATRSGGPEYFVNENNGILIEKGDQQALELAVLKLIQTYKDYDAKEISSEILGKFGMQAVGQQFIELYKSILSVKPKNV